MNKIATEVNQEKIGGLAFFLSFVVLGILSIVNTYNFFSLDIRWTEWRFFFAGMLLGGMVAHKFITGWVSVFLHELRHALLSNLVGNKWKGLVIKGESGHFEYAYSKKTARFNAFVALAPYWLPMFLILGGAVSVAAAFKYPAVLLVLIGIFYAIDLVLNFRDISPIQSDITEIKGGYGVGLTYIFIVNLFIFTLVAAWVSAGFDGVKYLFIALWRIFLSAAHF
jgi:hypothetical protein